ASPSARVRARHAGTRRPHRLAVAQIEWGGHLALAAASDHLARQLADAAERADQLRRLHREEYRLGIGRGGELADRLGVFLGDEVVDRLAARLRDRLGHRAGRLGFGLGGALARFGVAEGGFLAALGGEDLRLLL